MKVTGAKLHARQKEVIEAVKNGTAKYYTINASRQAGKSYLMVEMVRYFGLTTKGKQMMYVTPTYDLGEVFFTSIVESLEGTPLVKSTNKSKLTIEFITGTKLKFKSAERYENIRGGSYDFVFLDEFGFYKDGAWTAIKPTIAAKKFAKVIICSTPKGKNLFYDMAMLGQSDNPRYEYMFMHYSHNPMYDTEEVEDAKKVLPDDIYRQEYEAEFVDGGGTVFKDMLAKQVISEWIQPEDREKYFAGLDIGKVDSTVLTIYDKHGRIVYIHSDKEKSYVKIVEGMMPTLAQYRPLVYVEVNGVGDVFFDMLQTKYANLVAWRNDNTSKTDLIETFISALEAGHIGLPTENLCKALDLEMKVFIYDYSPRTRKIKYFAQPPFHDDHVISAALGYKAMNDNRFVGRAVVKRPNNKFNY